MKAFSPFDHRRDPEMGKALRDLLTPEDHDAFVTQVVHAARSHFQRGQEPLGWWDVLGAWARPGLAAAVALALIAVFGTRGTTARPPDYAALDNAIEESAAAGEATPLLLGPAPPEVEIVLAGYEN